MKCLQSPVPIHPRDDGLGCMFRGIRQPLLRGLSTGRRKYGGKPPAARVALDAPTDEFGTDCIARAN